MLPGKVLHHGQRRVTITAPCVFLRSVHLMVYVPTQVGDRPFQRFPFIVVPCIAGTDTLASMAQNHSSQRMCLRQPVGTYKRKYRTLSHLPLGAYARPEIRQSFASFHPSNSSDSLYAPPSLGLLIDGGFCLGGV